MYDVLVCDVDEKQYEGMALGLLYTAVSRGTTLGDDNGKNSAVYFKGPSMKPERIRNLTCKAGTTIEFEKAKQRRFWVNYLKANTRKSKQRVREIFSNHNTLFAWAEATSFSYDDLYTRIAQYKRRHLL